MHPGMAERPDFAEFVCLRHIYGRGAGREIQNLLIFSSTKGIFLVTGDEYRLKWFLIGPTENENRFIR